MTGTGPHLPSRQGCKVDVRPLLFDSFTMSPPNAFREVKGVLRLTQSAMTGKMKFWDQVRELEGVDVEVQVVLGETLKVVDRPFAGNVVGNHDITNGHIF